MANQVDFSVDQLTTFQKSWTVFSDPAFTVQANVAGFTGSMNVCYSFDQTQVIASYSTSGGNMSINVASSVVTVNIANTDFAAIQFPSQQNAASIDLVYDL